MLLMQLGHFLTLPDLYSMNGDGGLGNWCLMVWDIYAGCHGNTAAFCICVRAYKSRSLAGNISVCILSHAERQAFGVLKGRWLHVYALRGTFDANPDSSLSAVKSVGVGWVPALPAASRGMG